VILTEDLAGMGGAIAKARELAEGIGNAFIPMQFENRANPDVHFRTTAQEIWDDTDGTVDIVVAGVGTGGTVTGVAKALKQKKPSVQIIAVEPASSAVLSRKPAGSHMIQGIGAGFIPQVLDRNVLNEIILVTDAQAFYMTRLLLRKEGIIAGISSGAALHTAVEVSKRAENKNKLIVVILPDTGERYLSTATFEP